MINYLPERIRNRGVVGAIMESEDAQCARERSAVVVMVDVGGGGGSDGGTVDEMEARSAKKVDAGAVDNVDEREKKNSIKAARRGTL